MGATGLVIGVDVGTTGAKTVLATATGEVLAEAGQEYPTHYTPHDGAEQDPADWWTAVAGGIRRVLADAGEQADIAAVAVSSQAPSVVVVDEQGSPLHRALLWMDRRGRAECEQRADTAGDLLARTGNRLDPFFAAPKLAWLLRQRPELRGRAGATVLMANGYVVHQLTGALTCDTGHLGLTLLGDLATAAWAPDLLELWGIPASWLPEPTTPTTPAGTVTPAAARATGLRVGTPVMTGAVDGAAASLEAGLAGHGDVCEMTGQSTVLNAAFAAGRLRTGALGNLSVMPYPIAGHHLVFGAMVSTGGILRWFRDELGADGETFEDLDALAAAAPVGSGGLVLLPYFLGERSPIWDATARGALVGLSMASRRAEIVRAILEGTAYGLLHNVDELRRIGLAPAAIRSVGGGAKGRTWNQIKADVIGLPVEVPRECRGAPVGAALVAAAGAGLVDLPTVVAGRGSAAERFDPDAARQVAYQPYKQIYRDLYPALRETYEALAKLRQTAARRGTRCPPRE
ncbi:xylulokinase [Flindersiella endophytica]